VAVLLTSPGTATSPLKSCSVAISRDSVISASGTAPPNMPLCTACSSVRTSTLPLTMPRRPVVSAGWPMSQLPESAITMTSDSSVSRCSRSRSSSDPEPNSSSPSTKTMTPTGTASPKARSAATCAMTPALSSAVPRP
jgi:hypothetical protein